MAILSVGSASAKDLTVWITAPAVPEDNVQFTVDVTVDNDANGASGAPVGVQMYLDGSPLGAPIDFGQMNSGTRLTLPLNLTIGCGSHTIGAWVDPADSTAENNETNNNYTAALVIQPTLNFTHVLSGPLGEHNLTLTAVASGCLPLNYTWSVDGIVRTGSPVNYTPVAGPVNVTLTAVNTSDPVINRSVTRTLTIPNKAPSGSFTVVDSNASAPGIQVSTRQALGIQTQASDIDGSIASYLISFGDGNSTTDLVAALDYNYTRPGTYTVNVTITDNLGATNVSSVNVTVLNRPPEARTAAFLAGNAGTAISFIGNLSSDPDGGPITVTWSFGDGGNAYSTNAEHAYREAGTYTATMTVEDADGGTSTATVTVQVSAAADPGNGGLLLLGLIIVGLMLAALYLLAKRRKKDDKEGDEAAKLAESTKDSGKPPAP